MALPDSLPRSVRTKLEAAGIDSLEKLSASTARELLGIPGIGAKSLAAIEPILAEQGLTFAADEWGPYTCARHANETWDTQLSSMYLCDRCAGEFQEVAFAGTEPAYVGNALEGYCLNCNELRNVRIWQWFLCGVCDRVMRSLGRSTVANRFVLRWWSENVQPQMQGLQLELIDEPVVRARRREDVEDKVPSVDFVAREIVEESPVFGIELKTGRSYIRDQTIGTKINRFQLDHGDCDDILTVVARENLLPVYLFHAQVIDRAVPPTLRFVAIGLWWTDLFSMQEHYERSAQRPRETKVAAYYRTAMFRAADVFADHLAQNGPAELRARMSREGVPRLYGL
jgi:hypothetical protein